MKPLGYRNLNPCNIRYNVMNNWKGQTGCNKGFCTFDSMEHGYRAAFVLLLNYIKRGFKTPTQIISRWAPETENDTKAYIDTVVRYFNYTDEPNRYSLHSDCSFVSIVTEVSLRNITRFVLCMSYVELGIIPYKDTTALTMLQRSFEEAYNAFVKEFWRTKSWQAIIPTCIPVIPE